MKRTSLSRPGVEGRMACLRKTPARASAGGRLTAVALGIMLAAPGLADAAQAPSTKMAPVPQNKSPVPQKVPNILIIMLDDAGFAQSDTVGGAIHTPTLTRVAQTGIEYNAFHAAAISSATRAALLTGRNHHHVGNGSITEISTDAPGYNGLIPDSAATIPRVLHGQGYASAAFGKWHNTPPDETSPKGPFTHWPTGYGFDHFYGFLGGETDQYHPRLYNDTHPIEPPNDPKYHLTEDLAAQAVRWLDEHQVKAPQQPFFMYWAPGAVHAPHQVFKEWADKYKGKFDAGWDAYRQQTFERQKAMGWIPADTVNVPRPAEMPAWNSLSAQERRFQARLMEVYAGFLEHTDTQAGKVIDELERLGLRDNTLIFYVFSDNGASAEGMRGSINDLVGLNGITTTPEQNMKALADMYGGEQALGGPKVAEHYNAAWAWAGESPFVGTKLVAGYFGGTRVAMAASWPAKIKHDGIVRTQFHHVDDIAPTIYELLHIDPPKSVAGVAQMPLDGVSMAYTFDQPTAPTRKAQQYFEILGSRAEYADGWIASVFGPRKPWVADLSGLISWPGKLSYLLHNPWLGDHLGWLKWNPQDDQWALYDLKHDYSQSHDLAAEHPEKLAALKRKFDEDARANNVYPLGEALSEALHPRHEAPSGTQWHFGADTTRLPEVMAPNIRSRDNRVTVDAEFGPNANGVLYAMGGVSGGISLYVKNGVLSYEYNGQGLVRTRVSTPKALPAGHHAIDVDLKLTSGRRAGPAEVTLSVDGHEVGKAELPFTVPMLFTATETFDVGRDLGSPVSLDYFEQAPFAFSGKINDVHIVYR